MTRKLALALVVSAAFASPALAAQRGLPETGRCTHCLPGVVTGGPQAPVRGRVVAHDRAETPVATGGATAVSRGVTPPASGARGGAVVNAECGCAKGSCPTHA